MKAHPHRATHPLTKAAVALTTLALALMAGVLSGSPAHAASGTPRAQFWQDVEYTGDKLDKDVGSSGYYIVSDLTKVGRDCFLGWCSSNWNDEISSLKTDGGGQLPVHLIVFEHTLGLGRCMYVQPWQVVRDLRRVHVWNYNGSDSWVSWNDTISGFVIATNWDTYLGGGQYFSQVVEAKKCSVYLPW
jgi:hypothetical protein